jgi:hypothetical protein
VLSLAIGCAQQTQKNVTTQQKSTPQAAHRNARLTAAPKVPQKAGGTETSEKANQQIIDRLQIAAQIRKAATEQAQQSATQKPVGGVRQPAAVTAQRVARTSMIQKAPQPTTPSPNPSATARPSKN